MHSLSGINEQMHFAIFGVSLLTEGGTRRTKGTLSVDSWSVRFNQCPWSPRSNPWSLCTNTTTLLSSAPAFVSSKAARIFPS